MMSGLASCCGFVFGVLLVLLCPSSVGCVRWGCVCFLSHVVVQFWYGIGMLYARIGMELVCFCGFCALTAHFCMFFGHVLRLLGEGGGGGAR